jgi:Reverse transcriptase (RNA-dependent DNA polymerase)
MDFERFFPSITSEDLLNYVEAEHPTLGWDEIDRETFTRIAFRRGCLTIGAPTSPGLSNAICFELDASLESSARSKGVTYTRYADDLFFSTDRPDVLKDIPEIVQRVVGELRWPSQLSINAEKTRHSSKRGRRQVTGLVLTSDGLIGIGRQRKRCIRSLIHSAPSFSSAEKRQLAGFLAFARSIEPDFINALVLKFDWALIAEIAGAIAVVMSVIYLEYRSARTQRSCAVRPTRQLHRALLGQVS